jgi:hypothetical protein
VITHSTGALVVRKWIAEHYLGRCAEGKPLKNVVFLAGPHFGSRLAHHGRSMLAHASYRGDTGKMILRSLELGSAFCWETNEAFLDAETWRRKRIKPFALIGDRVERSFFKSKIFPAAYETGSDMVVRVPAGNVNFRRFQLDAAARRIRKIGEIQDVPFAALGRYTHSGEKNGIMNSIVRKADPEKPRFQNLALILECLRVRTKADYERVGRLLADATERTRGRRKPFAQLDLRFRDRSGAPVDDFSFVLGAYVDGERKPSKTVAHLHKNRIHDNQLTIFLDLKEFEPELTYFMEVNTDSGTSLFTWKPEPFVQDVSGPRLREIIAPDQTTQIDVVLDRVPGEDLFVFHRGDDPDLHVRWDRDGKVTRKRMKPK